MGQARTLNRGYELARGEILGYLSDDDCSCRAPSHRSCASWSPPGWRAAAYPGYRLIDAGEVVDTVPAGVLAASGAVPARHHHRARAASSAAGRSSAPAAGTPS